MSRWRSRRAATGPPASLAPLLAAIAVTYLGLGIIIPVRALYAREVGLSLAGIGAMASSFLLFNTLGQVPFGWLTDRIGRKPMIVAGITAEVVIILLYLVLTEPWTFIALRALEGVAAAAISPAARAYVGDVTPPERSGQAYGWLGAMFNGGILLGPAIGGWLSELAGYGAAFVGSAAGRLLGLALVLALVREPALHAARAATRAAAGVWRAAWSRRLVGIYLLGFCVVFPNGLYFALWSLWLQDIGASNLLIGLTYTAFALPPLLLAPVAGRLADRVGRLPLIVVPGLIDSVVYLVYSRTDSIALVLALSAFQGGLVAFIQPALDATVADSAPATGRGRVQGLYTGISLAGSFLSAVLCTVLYGWSRSAPFVLVTVVMLVALAAGLLLLRRQPHRQPSHGQQNRPVG